MLRTGVTALRSAAARPRLGAAAAVPHLACLSSAADAVGASPAPGTPYKKYKNRFKRATSTMAEINKDAFERMKYAFELSDAKPKRFKGIVVAKRNKGIDSKFTIMNAVDDDIITMSFPYSSPLLKEVEVYKKWHLHGGKRRCRKAKLYYLLDKPADEWKVK